ncbi:MAG: YheU family protein [Steroidobacteraceae bacterium]|nr:YheU family protein [Steroidobacteraceae bacterium]
MIVPHTELSPDALTGVIQSFVLREGTDYGVEEVSFETKVQQVLRQLERREAEIVFDQNTESIDIVVRRPVSSSSAAE